MRISQKQAMALRVQFFLAALATAVIFGLYLLCRGRMRATVYWVALPVCLFFTPRAWLRDIKSVWLDWWDMDRENTRRLLLTVLAATTVFSMAAYLYAFTNEFFNHDSLVFIVYSMNIRNWLPVGRPLMTLFDRLSGTVQQPWLLGMLFMLWMFLASVLAIRILHIQSTTGRALLCGLLCANTSLSNLFAHYTFCAGVYALSLMAMIAAAWFFCCCRHGEILGIYSIALSMLIYQAYFTAGVAFCFFVVVRMLVRNESARLTVLRGVRYLALLVAGFAAYYLSWTALCHIFGVEKRRLNDITIYYGLDFFLGKIRDLFPHFFRTQLSSGDFLGRVVPAINLLVMVMILFWLFCWLADKQLAKSNKVLLSLSVCALPVVLDLSYALFVQRNLSLVNVNMGFLCVFLLLCLSCPAPTAPAPRRYRAAVYLLAAALLWQSTVYSNSIYIKMDLNKEATVSLYTRIIERVEQTEGYVPGETPVAFSGNMFDNHFLSQGRMGYEWLTTAAIYDFTASWTVTDYIRYYLNYPMNLVSPPNAEEIADMPIFPFEGSIGWVGNIIVVKIA